MRSKLILVVVALLVLGGAGAYGAMRFFAPATDHAIELVPDDAVVYANVFLKPSTQQRQALRDLLERLPIGNDPNGLEAMIEELLDRALSGANLSYRTDVRPWLGHEVAAFMGPVDPAQQQPDGALLLATEDGDASLEAARSARETPGRVTPHKGSEIHDLGEGMTAAVVDGFLAIGTRGAIESVIETSDSERSLADSERFEETTDRLPDDRLATFFVDSESLFGGMPTGAGLASGLLGNGLISGTQTSGAVYATRDALVVDSYSTVPDGPSGELLVEAASDEGVIRQVPAAAWAALGMPELGRSIEMMVAELSTGGRLGLHGAFVEAEFRRQTGLDLRKDVLSWMGDAAVFGSGSSMERIGGAAVIEATDAAAAERAVHRLFGVLLARTELEPTELVGDLVGFPGFRVDAGGEGKPIYVLVARARIVVAYGKAAAYAAVDDGDSLGTSRRFVDAEGSLGPGFNVSGYLDIPASLDVVDLLVPATDDVYTDDVKPNLEVLSHVVMGSKVEGDTVIQRLLVELE